MHLKKTMYFEYHALNEYEDDPIWALECVKRRTDQPMEVLFYIQTNLADQRLYELLSNVNHVYLKFHLTTLTLFHVLQKFKTCKIQSVHHSIKYFINYGYLGINYGLTRRNIRYFLSHLSSSTTNQSANDRYYFKLQSQNTPIWL
jgi:hypothetical protein